MNRCTHTRNQSSVTISPPQHVARGLFKNGTSKSTASQTDIQTHGQRDNKVILMRCFASQAPKYISVFLFPSSEYEVLSLSLPVKMLLSYQVATKYAWTKYVTVTLTFDQLTPKFIGVFLSSTIYLSKTEVSEFET